MLIEFSVENFRSFRGRQTLSMVASSRLHKKENTFNLELDGEDFPDLLKVVAIYGPNASGKSNLVAALDVVGKLTRRDAAKNDWLPVTPFRFDPAMQASPSVFEVHFAVSGVRYEFHVAATSTRIFSEKLVIYPKGKEMLLYEREFDGKADIYTFGESLEGGSDLHSLWQKITGPTALFLSQAVANSSDEFRQLKIPCAWLRNGLNAVEDSDLKNWTSASQGLASTSTKYAGDIADFLRGIDVPIASIRFDDLDNGSTEDLVDDPGEIKNNAKMRRQLKKRMMLTHNSALGKADFTFDEESSGTRNLIGFWLPWTVHAETTDANFCTLVVDEMDSSLHPEIVVSLVKKHIKSNLKKQLIFSTHDTHLMNSGVMRRDQFWITERDMNGATRLISIHDFKGRDSEAIEKRYFEGKYRGLPIIKVDS